MSTHVGAMAGGGRFLVQRLLPNDLFTREDLTEEQQLFGQTAAEFMRKQVLATLSARGAATPGLAEAVRRLAMRPSVDTIGARRRIAAEVIQAGRYPY